MVDYLLDLGQNPLAKSLVKRLKLPIPLPEALTRRDGACPEQPLRGKTVSVAGERTAGREELLADRLSRLIVEAGGYCRRRGDGEEASPSQRHGAVFDATGLTTPAELAALYEFVKGELRTLAPSGRIVIVGCVAERLRSAAAAATQGALIGFVKSLARETGRRATTVQLLLVDPETVNDAQLHLPLTFLLSEASAFISGQALTLTSRVEAPEALTPLPWFKPLAGKVALVTGAAQGIGAEIAVKLAAEGARVIGVDRPPSKAALDARMQALGGTAWELDLLQSEAVKTLAARLEEEVGSLDILVNNAGITRDKTLGRMPREWWDDTLALNLSVPMALTEALALGDATLFRLMNPGGRILLLSSISGLGGNAGQTNYAAAKAGLIAYARALAPRLAPKGITINALAPGFIETEMTDKVPVATREVARRMNALNQGGRPADVAEAVAFLASPGAFGISGSVLRVCGLNVLGA